jgi:hypothetical protein
MSTLTVSIPFSFLYGGGRGEGGRGEGVTFLPPLLPLPHWTHEMKLKEGTIVDVDIVNKSGNLSILVKSNDGQEIYRGDNAITSNFSITMPKTNTYIFYITGENAKGSVSFKVAD